MIEYRHASPQAWRRLRKAVTAGELADIAKDITNLIVSDFKVPGALEDLAEVEDSIRYALTTLHWERKKQL
jgi:hypothetical protein